MKDIKSIFQRFFDLWIMFSAIILSIAAFFVAAAVIFYLSFEKIDSCMDSGGRWYDEMNQCIGPRHYNEAWSEDFTR